MNTIENIVLRENVAMLYLLSRFTSKSGWFKTSCSPPSQVNPTDIKNDWFKAETRYLSDIVTSSHTLESLSSLVESCLV